MKVACMEREPPLENDRASQLAFCFPSADDTPPPPAEFEDHVEMVSYVCNKTGGYVDFECTESVIQRFSPKLSCGAKVAITRGDWKGKESLIIGVRFGYLWRHDSGDKGARAFNARNGAELEQRYGLQVVGKEVIPNIERLSAAAAVTRAVSEGSDENGEFMGPKRPSAVRASSTKGDGWALGLLLGHRRIVAHFFAPVKGKDTVAGAIPRRLRLNEYDVGEACFRQFGFHPGDLVMLSAGPRAGRVAKILGLHQGRLVRQEQDDFPREFDANDPVHDSSLRLISRSSAPEDSYPEGRVSIPGSSMSFNCDPEHLSRRFGLLHRAVIVHKVGPRSGSRGVVVGIFGQQLYEFNLQHRELLSLEGKNQRELINFHGLSLIGAHYGPITSAPHPCTRQFPIASSRQSTASQPSNRFDSGQLTKSATLSATLAREKAGDEAFPAANVAEFDIRYSQTAKFGLGHYGDAVKVSVGHRFNTVGRIVGVRNKQLWVMFDLERGAEPVDESEALLPIARRCEPLAMQDRQSTENRHVFHFPSVFNRFVPLDYSVEKCAVFGFFTSQQVVYTNVDHTCSFLEAQRDYAAGTLPLKDRIRNGEQRGLWNVGVVLGVHRDELWVLDEASSLALPLPGSSREELLQSLHVVVVGLPRVPLMPFLDPLLHEGNGDFQSDCVYTCGQEVALQELPHLVACRSSRGSALAVSMHDDSFAKVGSSLRSGTRLLLTQRVAPRLDNAARRSPSDPDHWRLFAEEQWSTVLGIAGKDIYVVRDRAPTVAEAIADHELAASVVVAQHDKRYRTSPCLGRKNLLDGFEAKHAPSTTFDPFSRRRPRDVAAYAEGSMMDSRTVRDFCRSNEAELDCNELRMAFSMFCEAEWLPIVQWILSKFGLHLQDGETCRFGMMQLAAVQVFLGRAITLPTQLQWQHHQRQKMEESEMRLRDAIELQHAEKSRRIQYLQRTTLRQLQGVFDGEIADANRSQAHTAAAHDSVPFSKGSRWRRMMMSPEILRSNCEFLPASIVPARSSQSAVAEEKTACDTSSTMPPECAAPAQVSHNSEPRYGLAMPLLTASAFEEATIAIRWPFRYVLHSGHVVFFDICQVSCESFGLYHGQTMRITKGDLAGRITTILGVHRGRLWRYDEAFEAMPFDGSCYEDITACYGLQLVENVVPVRDADPFIFHTYTGEYLEFEVGTSAFQNFPGVVFGGRYAVDNFTFRTMLGVNAANNTTVVTIVGVRDSRVWFAVGWCGARPFDSHDIVAEMQLRFLYAGDVPPLHTLKDRGRHCAMVMSLNSTTVAFDVTRMSCEPFGLYPGQHVQHVSGPLIPQQSIIIGVHHGRLYRQLYSDRKVIAYDVSAAHKLRGVHGIVVTKWKSPPLAEISIDSSPWLVARAQAFRFKSSTGDMYTFDIQDNICRVLFGFSYGDKVVYDRPPKLAGRTALIIGVRQGSLWKVDDGDDHASIFHGVKRYADLERDYGLRVVGRAELRECV